MMWVTRLPCLRGVSFTWKSASPLTSNSAGWMAFWFNWAKPGSLPPGTLQQIPELGQGELLHGFARAGASGRPAHLLRPYWVHPGVRRGSAERGPASTTDRRVHPGVRRGSS